MCKNILRNEILTRDGPTPTNISKNSEPETVINGTCASPAVALASKVFPVPGGPVKMAPFGILAPKSMYCWGFFKKFTNSIISTLASSHPATSLLKKKYKRMKYCLITNLLIKRSVALK